MFIFMCLVPYKERTLNCMKKSDVRRNSAVSAVWALLVSRVIENRDGNKYAGRSYFPIKLCGQKPRQRVGIDERLSCIMKMVVCV